MNNNLFHKMSLFLILDNMVLSLLSLKAIGYVIG